MPARVVVVGSYNQDMVWRTARFPVPGETRLGAFDTGLGHHRTGQHGGMPVQRILDLEGGNVFTPRDDDVLAAVLDLHIAVGLHHRQITGVEPPALKGLLRGLGVLQVALHHDVPAKHDLAHGLAIGGHFLQGAGVHHRHALLQDIAHPLPAIEPGLFRQVFARP